MLRYEKDALESMTRQLKREAMDAVNKYEDIQISKSSLMKELEEMKVFPRIFRVFGSFNNNSTEKNGRGIE